MGILRKLYYISLLILSVGIPFQLIAGNPEHDPKLIKGTLKNGLTYYIYPNDFPAGEAVYRLFIKTGSMGETDSQRGLAHFLEHMAFNGTKNFPKDSLIRFLEGNGAKFGKDLNAHTSYNETVYKLQLPSKNADLVDNTLTILADWAGGMVLDSLEIEKERGVVLSEWLSKKGAGEEAQQAFLDELLNDSRFSDRTVIGDTSVIRNFSHKELRDYYQNWYDPTLMAIAVVGDVDPTKIEQLIDEKFGNLRSIKKKRTIKYGIDNYKGVEVKKVINDSESKIELNLFQMSKLNPPVRRDKDYYAYLEQSILNQLIKKRFSELSFHGPAYAKASMQVSNFLNTNRVLLATAELNPIKLDSSIHEFAYNLEQLFQYGFDSYEIAAVKTNYASLLKRKVESKRPVSSASIMEEIYGDFYKDQPMITVNDEYRMFENTIKKIDSVSLVRKLRSLNNPKKTHYLLTGHNKGVDDIPSSERILEIFTQARLADIPRYNKEVSSSNALLSEMPTEGSVLARKSIPAIDGSVIKLSNGANVIFKPSIKSDNKIMVTGFRKGGLYSLKAADYTSGLFASNVIALSGAGEHSRESLSHYLNGNSASVRFLIDKTRTGIAGSADVQDTETLLQLIYLKWTEPKVNEEVYNLVREKTLEKYRNTNRTEASDFRRDFSYLVNGKDYTTRELTDTLLIQELKEERLLPIFEKSFGTADGFTFIVTSDLPQGELEELVLRYLGGLPDGKADTSYQYKRPDLAIQNQKLERNSADSPKATVSLVFQQDSISESLNLFNLKNDILSAVLRMKLLHELREEMGLVYSVGVSGSATPYPSDLIRQTISFNCEPINVDLLIGKIKGRLKLMSEDPSSFAKELADVKVNLLKEMELNKQKDSFWSGYIRNSIFYNDTDWNYVKDFEQVIEGITVNDIAQLVSPYFLDSSVIQAVLYPKDQLSNTKTTNTLN